MTTKRQREANRRNAKKSTGPKTPEGKAVSSRNATKHGLLSSCPVLAEEDPEQYEELRRNLQEDLRPECQLETLLVNRIASAQWRLARVPALEAELLDRLRYDPTGADPGLDDGLGAAWERDVGPYGGALGRLARYETMLERSTTRLLAELRRLQSHRRKEDVQIMAAAQAEVNHRNRQSPMERGPMDEWRETPEEAWLAGRTPPLHAMERGPGGEALPQTTAAFLRSEPSERLEGRGDGRPPRALPASPSPQGGEGQPGAAGRGEVVLPKEPDFILGPTLAAYTAHP